MSKDTLLFYYQGMVDPWRDAFRTLAPEVRFQVWPEWEQSHKPEFALVWAPPPGLLAQYPTLGVIFSLGAGLDHLSSDPELPDLPLVRMVDPTLTSGMSEYVALNVLYHHRDMHDYARLQRQRKWQVIVPHRAEERVVGIMGVGELGSDVEAKLRPFGFKLRGWSRSEKHIDGVAHYHGDQGLSQFLADMDILVCLLPLTTQTRGILNAANLSRLARGAVVINAGRGAHVVEDDLLAALDRGQLRAASLDVFGEEPLPASSPLWHHPGVVITPHVASVTLPATAAPFVIEQMRRFKHGQPLLNVYDPARGY